MSANLQAALATVSFPANKDRVMDAARESGVSNDVLIALDGLPETDYADADALLHALG
ncbi:DUF2795 domain-containing protein [Robbsia andropogonis]|nr:DUF2795 domain-containing protein [Robbsia andropogonis]MCP1117504.1 DUF2795 domain-containing protein [Robbsia andropogonis]MCP1126970.1 DUF2795 domain-containing protein [Robbsia andropogonis]